MMDPERQSRLNEISKIAVHLETLTQVPAQLLVSQWALESKWGSKPVGVANYFGIKRSKRHEKCATCVTTEYIDGKPQKQTLEFADYDDLTASASDYCWLISNGAPYRLAWASYLRTKDVRQLLLGISRTYATDPSYGKLVQQIAGSGVVVEALAKARG